jgi:hypothetical protein
MFPNGKLYIGLTNNWERRQADHQKLALAGSKFPVHCAIRKYGWDRVMARILAIGEADYIRHLEVAAISTFETRNPRRGYNRAPGGEISPMHDPKIAAKVGRSKAGKPMSHATLDGWRRWFEDNRESHCANLSRVHLERWAAMDLVERAEAITKMSIARKGLAPPNKGKKVTGVALGNIRNAAKNRGPRWLANVSAANRAAPFTPARSAQLASARENIDRSKQKSALSARTSGSIWITDGVLGKRLLVTDPIPDGWNRGRPQRFLEKAA